MRYLGIDYGDKKIGLAVSDVGGRIAFPKKTVFNSGDERIIEQIKSFIEEEDVSMVIVGLPLALSGKETEQTKKVLSFADELKKNIVLPIDFENEMLTTRLVEKSGGVKKEHIDEAAAAVILQSYLDRVNPKS